MTRLCYRRTNLSSPSHNAAFHAVFCSCGCTCSSISASSSSFHTFPPCLRGYPDGRRHAEESPQSSWNRSCSRRWEKQENANLHTGYWRNANLMLALYRDSILLHVLSDNYVFEQLGFSPMASRLLCQQHLSRCRPFPTTTHPLSLRLMKVFYESLL